MRVGLSNRGSACHAQIHGCCARLQRTAERVAVYAIESWDMSGTWIPRLAYGCFNFFGWTDAEERREQLQLMLSVESRPLLLKNLQWLQEQYGERD